MLCSGFQVAKAFRWLANVQHNIASLHWCLLSYFISLLLCDRA